jgi:hypothetical protein
MLAFTRKKSVAGVIDHGFLQRLSRDRSTLHSLFYQCSLEHETRGQQTTSERDGVQAMPLE